MSLYESNHARFLRLAGDPAQLTGTLVSRVEGDCELQLSVLEHMPYTSTLALTYLLPAPARAWRIGEGPGVAAGALGCGPAERLPDLRLRAYHDARLLEVEACPPVSRPPAPCAPARRLPHDRQDAQGSAARQAERELQQRWMRNMMLNKWLEYCAERGHRFILRSTQVTAAL